MANTKSKNNSKKTTGSAKKTSGNSNAKTTPKSSSSYSRSKRSENYIDPGIKNNIIGLVLLAIGVFLIIALQTTASGIVGEKIGELLKGLFGFGAFLLPYFLIIYSILIFAKLASKINGRTTILLILLFLMIDTLNGMRFVNDITESLSFTEVFSEGILLKNSGIVGTYLANFFVMAVGVYGAYIVIILVIIISLLIILNSPLSRLIEVGKERKERLREMREERNEIAKIEARKKDEERLIAAINKPYVPKAEYKSKIVPNPFDKKRDDNLNEDEANIDSNQSKRNKEPLKRNGKTESNEVDKSLTFSFLQNINNKQNINDQEKDMEETDKFELDNIDNEEVNARKKQKNKKEYTDEVDIEIAQKIYKYKAPPIGILEKSKRKKKEGLSSITEERGLILERTLNSFGVKASLVNVTEGATITRYEVQPDIGVKVSSIVRLQDDIALNLKAKTMRMEAPIPGKAAVGIEVENNEREMVTLGDILATRTFQQHPSNIAFAVGKDIEGTSIIADLKKMPHLLIAGATGSGKSVCVNSIITSFLYKSSPEEVRLVLIDPKKVELGMYNGIPHLLIPVVTDPKKAASALNWAVGEMTDRYNKFAETGTKDITNYNEKMKNAGETENVLPQIVIVIDELADLMMVASSVVEAAICRLAQMARAAGMHLIVATQRPSVDVITGLIKSNIPSRIAFTTSSQIDSRTIIDMAGAEKLIGNGDMLFKTAESDKDKPVRIQCPFVSEAEIKKVIEYILLHNKDEAEYEEEVIDKIENSSMAAEDDMNESDMLVDDAALAVISAGQASVSMLQRKFRIGYNRAARIIDELEEMGVIGPSEGSKPRQVLMNQMEWDDVKEAMK